MAPRAPNSIAGDDRAREDHPAPARHRVSPRALWFGVLAAPAAWGAHATLATLINGSGCITHWGAQQPAGAQLGSGRGIALLALTGAFLALALIALFISWRNWESAHSHAPGEESELLEAGEGRARFMAMGGILLSAIFSLLLIMNSISLFLAPQCTP